VSAATTAQLDHLVVAARTLEEGVAWCEGTLGVMPGPGGEHALFGTHNRLLRLHSASAPHAYLEIIAIHPTATPTRAPGLKRWFDLDDPALQQRLAQHGPQLIHWVASVPDIHRACDALRALDLEPGPVLSASRPTPRGLLQWQISVRDDGQRLMGGALPTLIQWGDTHPASSMDAAALRLQGLQLSQPSPARLREALRAIGADGTEAVAGPAALRATIETPRGTVVLNSIA
jgi:hypothetical protein